MGRYSHRLPTKFSLKAKIYNGVVIIALYIMANIHVLTKTVLCINKFRYTIPNMYILYETK